VPSWPLLKTSEEAALGFSRLTGVVIPPDRAELLFVGVDDPALPRLSVDDLTDAFVIALRALPGAPGVSIDPTPAQLRRGLREGDAMSVRYIGGDERSVVGLTAFEADRLMKSLSFGKDNLTGQPFSSAVPGYRSELDAILASPDKGDKEWHRFWIEQADDLVEASDDGRTLLVTATLRVRTEYMQARDGALVPGNREPSGPAREFSGHLTSRYDAYARELRAYHDLLAYAQMVALGGALADPKADQRIREAADALDLDRLIARANVRTLDTPVSTPAIVASKSDSQQRMVVSLTGGVDLTPRLRYRPGSPRANDLARTVLASAGRNATRATWNVPGADGPMVVVRRPLMPADTRLWQTDMMVGPVRFVRVSSSSGDGSIGRQWKPMLPELRFSSEVVELQEGGRSPRFAAITTLDGTQVILGQPATLQMPGQPATPGFSSTTESPRRRRRALYRYTNVIVLDDGEIKYVTINGGSPQPQFAAGAARVEFAATAPHRALRLRTSDGEVAFLWDGDRLNGYRAESGERVTFRYDTQGRIVGLDGSDGQQVDYRVDVDGNLRAVVNRQGQSISYGVSDADGRVKAISAEFKDMPLGGSVDYAQLAISQGMRLDQVQAATRQFSNDETVFIGLTEAPAGADHEIDVVIAGQAVGLPGSLERALEAVLSERGSGPRSAWLRDTFLGRDTSRGRSNVVVVGEPYMRNLLARGLVAVAPQLAVSTAANPQRAAQNLQALQRGQRGFRHVHVADGLDASINAQVERLPATSQDGDLVIISGHNSVGLENIVEQLGNQRSLEGKTVLLLTCGVPGAATHDALLRDAGAAQVVSFSGPIDARLLPRLTRDVRMGLERSDQPASRAILKVLQDAIEGMSRQGIEGVPAGNILVLESQVRQIGRRSDIDIDVDLAGHSGAVATRAAS
jgi:YD repeat-containing protein